MSDMVTRCPACSTSFRITPGQIQKARGAVRCGSCLHIFNAEQYLIAGAKTKPVSKPATKPAPKTSANPAPAPRQVPLAIDSSTDTAKTRPAAAAPAPKPAAVKTSLREKLAAEKPVVAAKAVNPKPADTKPSGLHFDQSQIDRESASDDNDMLISDDMDKNKNQDSDDNLLYIDTKPSGHSLFDRNLDADDKPEFTDDSDESWADSLLEEDSPPLQPAPKAPPPSALSIINTGEAEAAETTEQHTTSVPEPRFHISGSRDDDEDTSYRESIKAFDRERSAMLFNIDPEPVEMTVSDQQEWRRKLMWGGLSALAVVILVAQVAWLQFDRLSRVDPYRGYYKTLCSVIGCTLPARVDTRQIRSYNLVVRNHPEQTGALLVDAIIINNAGFAQPFPELLLSFSDINNRPVASRAFKPEEYLRGELAGTRTMPANQPVHLSLEITDPGAHAVNYQLRIH